MRGRTADLYKDEAMEIDPSWRRTEFQFGAIERRRDWSEKLDELRIFFLESDIRFGVDFTQKDLTCLRSCRE